MPKMKTKKSAAKRFSLTKNGKVKRKSSKLRHILTTRTTKQKRKLRRKTYVSRADQDNIRRLLPYG